MAKLQKYELEAITNTIIDQLNDYYKDCAEQLEYNKLYELSKKVKEELNQELKTSRQVAKLEFEKRYPKLKFDISNYGDRLSVLNPTSPNLGINRELIERELIVSNIKGDVEETIEKIVNKYKLNK